MPAMFLNDPEGKKYKAAYFEGFPHVWTHGDFAYVNPETKGIVITGRSDGVLNPSGIRFGSGDIYAVLERHFKGKFLDAICVAQQRHERDQSERVLLFLQLPGEEMTVREDLVKGIKDAIATDLSRRHVPNFVFAARRIPYNVNGKRLEIPLKAVISEGEKAFGKRKFTAEERDVLEDFLPYFEVEKMAKNHGGGKVKAKL
ncbi:Acetoacetyl-CoA synthetase [Cyphellophora attinorum]|uniref:Acetoacetyl-CoA synthetase n=1 Tax=Cyphellophora attinorum TaxID=1664694 RepID=A0A0N0NNW3_9EURO|nr:Acetoacetyl-CoA synthetase [Phialophora attinorum]KPI42018.1 Acetoacetyl-CoA synthetase [Phialophora attinorum]